MDAKKIVYDRFFKPFENKITAKKVGVELEFPLVSLDGGEIDEKYAASIMEYFLAKGYKCVLYGTDGELLFMENEAGDCISFDNSYNNFEFSLSCAESLTELEQRFRAYLPEVLRYLEKGGMTLVGRGTNPNKKRISQHPVPFSTYKMVDEFLHKGKSEHDFPDFPAYLSSVQTHLDVNLAELPRAYTLFAKLDFLRALLFANSPDWDNLGYILYRDFLWEKSAFAGANITGKVDEKFSNVDEMTDYFLKKCMFNRVRGGKYEIFAPVPIEEYFQKPDAEARDIECYLSFKNVEATARGTLEVRGDCAQPFDRAFAPPAFSLGILAALDKAAARTDEFFRDNNITKTNSQLRDIVCTNSDLEQIAPIDKLNEFKADMLSIAREALARRGRGEQRLLNVNA